MDTDLSLIEISAEDEDEDEGSLLLLQQEHRFVPGIDSNGVISCSPLRISRSKASTRFSPIPTDSTASKEEAGTASCSYHVDSGNKEHSNANKSELPKLSLEPQQMKRKKKGGGCNLRKSLAWNKAFFTEEGVLDPEELSIINGNFGKSSGELLSGIKEEEMELSFGSSDCNRNSSYSQTRKESLLKGLPGRTPRKERKNYCSLLPDRTPKKDRKINGDSFPNPKSSTRANLSPSPAAKRKVLSPYDVNKSGSKRSSCPQTMALSSQKSLAGASATKSTIKEPKVSKIPAPKQDPQLLCTTVKTVVRGLSYSTHKPFSEPASMHKNASLNGFPKKGKAHDSAKFVPVSRPLMAKSSIPKPRRKEATSHLEVPLPTNLKHPVVTEAKNNFKIIRGSVIPTINRASTVCAGESSESVASLPHSANQVDGNQQPQPPAAKPSGLRMPSPSLGFFGQSKASASLGTAQPCNLPEPSISNMQKYGALNSSHGLRPPRPPSKIPANKNMNPPSLSSGCPVSTTIFSSHENMKYKFGDGSVQKVEGNVSSNLNSQKTSETIAKKQQLNNTPCDNDIHFLKHGEVYKTEMLILENKVLQKHENKPVSRSEHDEQLENETDIRVAEVCQKRQDLGGAGFENSHIIQPRPAVQVKVSVSEPGDTGITVHADNEKSQGKPGLLIPRVAETDGNFNGIQGQQMENGILSKENGSSEDFQKHNIGDIVDVSFKSSESDNSDFLFDKYAIQEKDFDIGGEDMCRKQHAGDVLVQSLNGNLAVERGCSILTISVADDKENFEGQAEHSHLHFEEVQGSEDNYGSHLRDYLLKDKRFSSEESQKQNALQSVLSLTPEGRGSYVSTLRSSSLCHAQPSVIDCGSDEAESMNCQLAEDVQLGFVDSISGAEIEHPHLTSQHNHVAQVIGGYKLSHVVGQVDVREHQYNPPVEEQGIISDFHPGEEIVYCNQVRLGGHSDLLGSDGDVTEQVVERPYMKNICYSECDKRCHEENQSAQMYHDLLVMRSSLFEESQISDTGREADVNPEVEGFGGDEFQSSRGLLNHENIGQANKESIGVDSAMKEFLAEDGSVQCRDYNLLVGSFHTNMIPSAVCDHVNGECGEDPQLQYTSHIDKVLQDNQKLSLGNDLSLEDIIYKESEEKNVVETFCEATSERHSPSTISMTLALEDLSPTGEIQEKLEDSMCPIQDKDAAISLTKSGSDKKQCALMITPPPYAAPFSDELLAAFEAAGEEILTMKSGAVQNSPTDKAPAEPGPYSPVRRKKNQSIGPYDCTKYTNVGGSSPQ